MMLDVDWSEERWRFRPATKTGNPLHIHSAAQLGFGFPTKILAKRRRTLGPLPKSLKRVNLRPFRAEVEKVGFPNCRPSETD